jgi:glycosyltransferase involved in cell wall biosynthesis
VRFLIIQENGRHEENRHMRECFSLQHSLEKLGHKASCWGLGHESYEKNKQLYLDKEIDVIFCLENYNNGWLPEGLSSVKAIKVFWSIDSHCALRDHVQFCTMFKPQIFLTSAPGYIKDYRDVSEKQYWFPNAIDKRWFNKKDIPKNREIVFAASPIADRLNVSNFLRKMVGLELISNCKGEDYVNLIRSAKVSFNKSISDDINYRIFESLACGTALSTNNVSGLDQLFVLDQDLAVYNNEKEMVGVTQWLLKDDVARNQIAENGHKRTMSMHTYDNRAQYMCEIIDSL